MKKIIIGLLVIVGIIIVVPKEFLKVANKQIVRTAEILDSDVDYQTFFNEFDNASLLINENDNSLKFNGTKKISSSIFEEYDLVTNTTINEQIDFNYEFDYCADTNEFNLSVKADTENGEIIDNWKGIPYTDKNGDIDIVFNTDDGIIYLSELEENNVIANCGWFSKLLKKVAKVAAVIAVVAVVVVVIVVAAPAVAAAATAIGTTLAVSGGAALTGAAATAAISTAAIAATATTAFAIASTTALVAGTAAVMSYIASKAYDNFKEKVEATAKELEMLKEYEGTMLFRGARYGNVDESMIPRSTDDDGLSFFDSITVLFATIVIKEGVYITSTNLIDSTKCLSTDKKGSHYGVLPLSGQVSHWTATHTKAIKGVSCYVSIK